MFLFFFLHQIHSKKFGVESGWESKEITRHSWCGVLQIWKHSILFQCCGSGSGMRDPGAFLTPGPGSGIRNRFFPDPRSRITNSYFLEISDKFLGKSLKTGPNFFLQHFKNKIIFNFVKFVATKKVWQHIFFHPSLLLLFLDPGTEIRDPGWVKIRINIPNPQHWNNLWSLTSRLSRVGDMAGLMADTRAATSIFLQTNTPVILRRTGVRLRLHLSFFKVWWPYAFLFVFIFLYNRYIHTGTTFIHKHSLWPISMSSQLSAFLWGADPRFELGPALHQSSALPTEPRYTLRPPSICSISRARILI